jgi:ribosome-associated toxin RatA of RatAB toxin-antitoxin module
MTLQARRKNTISRKEHLDVMPKYDVVDEAIIDASPIEVYNAVLNEYAGVTHWWMPHIEFKLRGDTPVDREGAICDLTTHSKGMTAKFSCKITRILEAKSIEMEYSGDFVGTGKWTFESTDGKTKVQFRWNNRPNRLLFVLFSPFVNLGKVHSDTIQKGFKACNSYLCRK